jgi:hypothetical protein
MFEHVDISGRTHRIIAGTFGLRLAKHDLDRTVAMATVKSKQARLVLSIAVALLIALSATTVFDKASKVDVIIGFNDAPGASGDALVEGLGGTINSRYSIINAGRPRFRATP